MDGGCKGKRVLTWRVFTIKKKVNEQKREEKTGKYTVQLGGFRKRPSKGGAQIGERDRVREKTTESTGKILLLRKALPSGKWERVSFVRTGRGDQEGGEGVCQPKGKEAPSGSPDLTRQKGRIWGRKTKIDLFLVRKKEEGWNWQKERKKRKTKKRNLCA